MRLDEVTEILTKAMKDKEPQDKVKEYYDNYVEVYKSIKAPKVIHMFEFRDLFFKYHEYMQEKK
jgi:hypothetical protein